MLDSNIAGLLDLNGDTLSSSESQGKVGSGALKTVVLDDAWSLATCDGDSLASSAATIEDQTWQ